LGDESLLATRVHWREGSERRMKQEVRADAREMERAIDTAWSARGYESERRETMTDQHSEQVPGGIGDRTESPVRRRAAAHRPGMVTFAAVMMFVVAGLEALTALLAFAGTGWWVTEAGNLVYANFVILGIVDSIIALIALYAGIDLLRGGPFGLGMGYLFAIVGAIRWLFFIPAAPVLAVVVVALCVMVIYGLAKYSDQLEST
jgi:hypothetical protein